MLLETLKKIRLILLDRIHNQHWRQQIQTFGDRLIKFVGVTTLLSAIVTLVISGSELVTKTIPGILANVSRSVMLGGTLRPWLLDSLVRNDLGYHDLCIGESKVVDLDEDGRTTDLIVSLYAQHKVDGKPSCAHKADADEPDYPIFAILKEVRWDGLWPEYTLLHAIRLEIPEARVEVDGRYIVGITSVDAYSAYHVYAYANGALHRLGSFNREIGAATKLQMRSRLFLKTEEGLRSFEIKSDGKAQTHLMTPKDIVTRNNTSIIVEDEANFSDEVKNEVAKIRAREGDVDIDSLPTAFTPDAHLVGDYLVSEETISLCTQHSVFQNGWAIPFKSINPQTSKCVGEIQVKPTTQIVLSNVRCALDGFRESPQFPWGWIADTSKTDHTIRCPHRGNEKNEYRYELKVTVPKYPLELKTSN